MTQKYSDNDQKTENYDHETQPVLKIRAVVTGDGLLNSLLFKPALGHTN